MSTRYGYASGSNHDRRRRRSAPGSVPSRGTPDRPGRGGGAPVRPVAAMAAGGPYGDVRGLPRHPVRAAAARRPAGRGRALRPFHRAGAHAAVGRVVPAGLPVGGAERAQLVRPALPDGGGVRMVGQGRAEAAGAGVAALVGNAHRQLRPDHRVGPDGGRARPSRGRRHPVRLGLRGGAGHRLPVRARQAGVVPARLPHRPAAGRLFPPGGGRVRAEAAGAGRRPLDREDRLPDADRPQAEDRIPSLHRVLPLRRPVLAGRAVREAARPRRRDRVRGGAQPQPVRGAVPVHGHWGGAGRLPVAGTAVVPAPAHGGRRLGHRPGLVLAGRAGAALADVGVPGAPRGVPLARFHPDRRLHAELAGGADRHALGHHGGLRLAVGAAGARRGGMARPLRPARLPVRAGRHGVAAARPRRRAVRHAGPARPRAGRGARRQGPRLRARRPVEPAPRRPPAGGAGRAGHVALASPHSRRARQLRRRRRLVPGAVRRRTFHVWLILWRFP